MTAMRTTHLLHALALLALARSVPGQEDAVARALVTGRTTLRIGADGPAGDGLDFLRRELASAHHFLIGESHGTKEVPELVGWILGLAREAGYSTLFLETGPISQELANGILSTPDGVGEFARFMDEHYQGIAFLGWEGEAVMAAEALAGGWTVAGLDQEFIASGRHLLARLEALAPTDAARALARAHADAEHQLAARVRRTGDRSAMAGVFIGSAAPAVFDALEAAYAGAGTEAQRILAEMRQSSAIYRLWMTGANHESNRLRVEMIKRHLREHVAARLGGDWRRLRSVSKFGGGHCARGLNSNSQYDLGNHLSELAEAAGSRSFHLLVLAATNNAPGGMSRSGADGSELGPLIAAAADDDWTFLDLRPLRALAHDAGAVRDVALREVVFGFDAVAIAPLFTPAAELVPR